jgi:alpha-mannosidase
MTSPKKLHMIGNAHIDPVWLWQWQEGFHEVKASFRSALDRINEFKEFTFVSSSAAFYEWVEQSDPAMFDEICRCVADGRWEIVGGWWIQPDCNIPGGESFVRQGLYGQRYFKEKFGVTATVGYNVDSFGHAGSLPQILKKSGLDTYVFMRPSPHEKGLPGRLFWWEADDGSRVLTFRIPYEYCTWGKELDKHIRRCAAEIKAPFNELMCFYGVGNHGGGPTRENIESIRRLQDDPDLPQLVFSTPNRFFEAITARDLPFPTVHEDLQHHASGTYAAHSGVKRWNRLAESLLMTAESWSAVALRATGQPYPADFDRAWKGVLFNQFHDIMAGTSIEGAYEDARDLYGEAMSIGSRALNLATQSVAWNVNVPYVEGSTPVTVFNPHAWETKSNVQLETGRRGHLLVDDQDRPVPVQYIQSHATAGGRFRISFLADLPALGYRTFHLRPGEPADAPTIEATDTVLDNGRIRLEFNPQTGNIASLRDLRHNIEVFAGAAAIPTVIDDSSDTWSHNVFHFDKAIGQFLATSLGRVEHGPVKSVIRVKSSYNSSRLVQDFTMYRDIDRIDVRVFVDWREQMKALKFRFPLNQVFMRAVHEIPYGHIERFAGGEEEPTQRWIDVSGVERTTGISYGLSLINDGKYSFDVHIRDIGLMVLRSPIYAHHIPAEPDPEGHYSYMDQGIQRFTYSLLPHPGKWETAGTVRHAAEINQPPVAIIGTYHPEGTLPQSASFLRVEPDNVLASVLKKAEEGDDLILRCYETNREATRATIHFPQWDRRIEADFGPCEIKTFRIPADAAQPVVETNLIEE